MNKIPTDLWVLTETYQAFSPGPEYRLVAYSADAPDRDAKNGECWVAIWVRVGLTAERHGLTMDLERVAATQVNGSVTVVGTVLPWLGDNRHPEVTGEAAFRDRLSEQLKDWMTLRKNEKSQVCVAGDFNQDLLDLGHCYGSKGGREALRAALAAAQLKCLSGGDDDPLPKSSGKACIDHICVGGMRAKEGKQCHSWPAPEELKRTLTDHFGTWVELESAASNS